MPRSTSYTVTVTAEVEVKPDVGELEELTPDKALARAMEPFLAIPSAVVTEARVIRRA
jgi:hypothetical protein